MKALFLSITISIFATLSISGQSATAVAKLKEEIRVAEAALVELQKKYSSNYPAVVETTKLIADLKEDLKVMTTVIEVPVPTPKPMSTPPMRKPAAAPMSTPQRCDLTLDKAPIVRGLKLGMPERDADTLLGGALRFSPDPDDFTRTAFAFPHGQSDFEGIGSVTVRTFDGYVYELELDYDDSIKWFGLDELVDNFAPKLGLPRVWGLENRYTAKMTCKEFDVRLALLSRASLRLTDGLALGRIAERRVRADEEKKKAVKP